MGGSPLEAATVGLMAASVCGGVDSFRPDSEEDGLAGYPLTWASAAVDRCVLSN